MAEYRRHLPHLHPDRAYLFLTWRLWGSMPKLPSQSYPTPGHGFVALNRILDRSRTGPRWLANSQIAQMVARTILEGESEQHFYELHAWVIMPNHVHLLILPKMPVPMITRWPEGSTARRANDFLGKTGQQFWQAESYDRWVRDRDEFNRIIRYIERNPVSAGLVESMPLYQYSSAWQAKPPALLSC